MLYRILSIIIGIQFAIVSHADNYTVDNRGNVIFDKTIENLPLSKDEIYKAAADYIENAYKDTRYNIVENNSEAGNITGEGELINFHEQGGLVKSVLYSLKFYLRVDAKDGRARVRLIARTYSLKTLSDVKSSASEDVIISDCEPIGKVKNKGHKKAFEILSAFAEKTINNVSEALKSATPAVSADDDW
ncbi:MAG: DUF4468 domain-containing protein [Paramuribaculum sp.]|nr:DUF4468 domain-containing protein [Paramuribaculum sp.]